MKKIILSIPLLILLIVNFSCLKGDQACTPRSVASEQAQIMAYASANGIAATQHSTGLFYEVITPGTGITPNMSSRVFVTYTGMLLNGTVFDQQSNHALTGWVLGQLIPGWQVGLPLIQKGGHIKLIIPSSLAYGCMAAGSVPPNSILYFDVELIDVQ